MNFKPELLAKIIAGEKTQTRRPVKPGDEALNYWRNPCRDRPTQIDEIGVVRRNGRDLWRAFQPYAAAPGRGKRGVARIMFNRIRRQDVRNISDEDVRAEGFEDRWQFLSVWMGFYDKVALRTINGVSNIAIHAGIPFGAESIALADSYLRTRPDKLYDGWALSFVLHEVIEVSQPALLTEASR